MTERGALAPALDPAVCPEGMPPYVECLDTDRPIEEATLALREGLRRVRAGDCAAIVVDTLSSLADREFVRIRVRDKVQDQYGRANRMLADRIKSFLWEVMESGALLICICHEREPSTIEGKFTPGGPKLPGGLVVDVPSLFSIVLRCKTVAGPDGRPARAFGCDPLDRSYVTGDRYTVVTDGQPMDLRAVLRAAVGKARGAGVRA